MKLAIILVLCAAALLPSITNGFVFDDRNVLGSVLMSGRWTRALTQATYRLDFMAGGFDGRVWHGTNIAIHMLNAVLVYVILLAIVPVGAAWGAAVFAIHPLFAEGAQYVTARSSELAATFTWAALASGLWLRGWKRVVLVAASIALAMLSKEEGWIAPIVLAASYVVLSGKKHYAGLFVIIMVVMIVALHTGTGLALLSSVAKAPTDMEHAGMANDAPFGQYVGASFQSFMWHILPNIAMPARLTFDAATEFNVVWACLAIAFVAVLIHDAFYSELDTPLRLGIALVLLTPPLARVAFTIYDSAFEYRAYMCGLGVAMIAGYFLSRIDKYVAAGVVAVLMLTTMERDRVWASELSLYEDAVTKTPTPRMWNDLGVAYKSRGRDADAVRAWKKSNTPIAESNIAAELITHGHYSEAAIRLRKASEAAPELPQVWVNYSALMLRVGNFPQAKMYAERALSIDVFSGDAMKNLADAEARLKR